MRIKIISFMTPLYVVGFFVLTWAVWAHTTCPDTAEATVLEKARIDLKFKQPDDVVKEKPADKDVLKYTAVCCFLAVFLLFNKFTLLTLNFITPHVRV